MTDTQSNPGEKGKDDSDRTVPLAALEAERNERQLLARQVAELTGKLEGFTRAKPVEQKKTYTNAELRALIDRGSLTESAAADIRDRQNREATEVLIRNAVRDTQTEAQRTTTVSSAIQRYLAALPDIDKPGTPERAKAEREFNRLTNDLGYPADDPRTQLLAIQTAFGSVDALEAAKPGSRETHEETGGAGGGEKSSGSGWPKDMPAANRAYYQDLIARKVYTKDSAIAEWNHPANKRRGKAA